VKILITGGAGFIGSNLAHHYQTKHSVTVLDNLSRPGIRKNLSWLKKSGPLNFIKADIRDQGAISQAVKNQDLVLHLAGQVAVTTSVEKPREDFEINALGSINILEAARQQPKPPILIYSSTNKVYGKISKPKVNESQPLNFHSPYGCSKGAADQYFHDYHRIYGLRTIVFRQSCIYGLRQFGTEDQGWVAHFALRAINKQPITIYGDGNQIRDLLYIDDLISAYDSAIDKIDQSQGQIYNLGGGPQNKISLLELIKLLEIKLKIKIPLKFEDWRPGDQKIYVSDIAKIKKHLGWQPKIKINQGLDLLLDWLKSIS